MSAPQLTREALAAIVDHTLLAPEATDADVARLAAEAAELRVAAACVSASRVPAAARELAGTGVAVAAVVGFPSGAHRPDVKAFEGERAVTDGAAELDMVIDLGDALAGEWDRVSAEIAAVRAAAPSPVVLKVIIEAAVLDERAVGEACRACEQSGADIVKTSTGFHPAGGATVAGVALIASHVAPRLGIKAAGGIRSAAQAREMIGAGATRLGMSRTRQVLDELGGGRA